MIPEPVAGWVAALNDVHEADLRVALYTGSPRTFRGYLEIERGSLRYDGRADIMRSATFDIALGNPGSVGREAAEYLSVAGGEIEVDFGVKVGATFHYATIATLRVDSMDVNTTRNKVSIEAFDRSIMLQEYPLILPWTTQAGETYAETIGYLVADADIFDPVYVAGGVDTTTEPRPGTQYSGDRLRAIHDAAASIGARFFADQDGAYRVRNIPTPNTAASTVWTALTGSRGNILEFDQTYSRRDQYNAIALSVEPPEGDISILVFLVDADPTSPTFWLGPFGRKVLEERSDELLTEAQAIAKATALLDQYQGATRALDLTTVYNPLLEPDDAILVKYPDDPDEVHFVDAWEISFPRPAMKLETRLNRSRTYSDPLDIP